MSFRYTVHARFDSEALRQEWCQWLERGHLADVCRAGAEGAEVVLIDGELSCEVRYRFASRDAFMAYERDHAPRLRAEGLALFSSGVELRRTTGEIASQI